MEEAVNISSLTKEQIINMKFPNKMWILINTPNRVIKWGRHGTSVLIDNNALAEYLCSTYSIFKTKCLSSFIRQMNMYGFQKFTITRHGEEAHSTHGHGIVVEYQHDHFLKNRPDFVDKIIRRNGVRKPLPSSKDEQQVKCIDSCPEAGKQSKTIGKSRMRILTTIERARLNLRIILEMQAENYSLTKRLLDWEPKLPTNEVTLIKLPPDFDPGYYCSEEDAQIQQFFDEYLPTYAESNANGGEGSEQITSVEREIYGLRSRRMKRTRYTARRPITLR